MHPPSPSQDREPVRWQQILLPGLLGAYLNCVVYGFVYGRINHDFQLPLLNWLRNQSLYPNDPIRESFLRFPIGYETAIAYFSRWFTTEHILFASFLLTKLIFFLALARLVAGAVKDGRLVACIVASVALSGFLEQHMPFGASDVLKPVETHSSLAFAVLLLAGVLLVEGRWLVAGLLLGLTTYVNALLVLHNLFAFAAFALLDWRQRRREILLASLLAGALFISWLLMSPQIVPTQFPADYVQMLLQFYPFHLTLQSHSASDLLSGFGLLAAMACMVGVVARMGLSRHRRLEVLAASFLVPVSLGALAGWCFLTPHVARLQLLRADAFLFLYGIVLLQNYAANLLVSGSALRSATTVFLGSLGILLPNLLLLLALPAFFLCLLVWYGLPLTRSELRNSRGSATAEVISNRGFPGLTAAVLGVALAVMAVVVTPRASRLWNFVVEQPPPEMDWREIQQWAKMNSPLDTQFLVPTWPPGFRAFSERSSWGEWKDGNQGYYFPPMTDIYRQRMAALGIRPGSVWIGFEAMRDNFKRLSWERLVDIARENHLRYIVQYRDVAYPVPPAFANNTFAIYKVPD